MRFRQLSEIFRVEFFSAWLFGKFCASKYNFKKDQNFYFRFTSQSDFQISSVDAKEVSFLSFLLKYFDESFCFFFHSLEVFLNLKIKIFKLLTTRSAWKSYLLNVVGKFCSFWNILKYHSRCLWQVLNCVNELENSSWQSISKDIRWKQLLNSCEADSLEQNFRCSVKFFNNYSRCKTMFSSNFQPKFFTSLGYKWNSSLVFLLNLMVQWRLPKKS